MLLLFPELLNIYNQTYQVIDDGYNDQGVTSACEDLQVLLNVGHSYSKSVRTSVITSPCPSDLGIPRKISGQRVTGTHWSHAAQGTYYRVSAVTHLEVIFIAKINP
jgi:hypothetical protein